MQNMPAPGNDHAIFQLDHRIRKEPKSGGIPASNAPYRTAREGEPHESRAAIIAILDPELFGKVAHTVFVVSVEYPDVIDAHPDLVHKAWVHRSRPVDNAIPGVGCV